MRKYIKYEIKGNYKFILGILAIIIIASTIIQANILKESKRIYVTTGDTFTFMDFLLIIAVLVMFGSFLVAFFRIIGSFRNELYDDRGYLTFTLPLTGNQILGAKLVVAVLWTAVLAIVMASYNLILSTVLFGLDWSMLKEVIANTIGIDKIGIIMRVMPVHLLSGGISLFGTLIFIFLSMALGKVSIRNRKIGGLWFIIFIVISVSANFLIIRVANAVPLYFDLINFKFVSITSPFLSPTYSVVYNSMVEVTSVFTHLSVTRVLMEIAIYVAGFILTGYLIEKKIDL
ncbi:MAG: hypothetical protein RIN55_00080 [Tissierellaceae bacterium]|nr:hypothetical protein [Tissierellaceae bacterium]